MTSVHLYPCDINHTKLTPLNWSVRVGLNPAKSWWWYGTPVDVEPKLCEWWYTLETIECGLKTLAAAAAATAAAAAAAADVADGVDVEEEDDDDDEDDEEEDVDVEDVRDDMDEEELGGEQFWEATAARADNDWFGVLIDGPTLLFDEFKLAVDEWHDCWLDCWL